MLVDKTQISLPLPLPPCQALSKMATPSPARHDAAFTMMSLCGLQSIDTPNGPKRGGAASAVSSAANVSQRQRGTKRRGAGVNTRAHPQVQLPPPPNGIPNYMFVLS